LLSNLTKCPNRLSSLLSTASINGTSFSIPQISLLLYFLSSCLLQYLVSAPANPLSHLIQNDQLSET
jgi:hypothetical protein